MKNKKKNILVFGAGSIGAHHIYAARKINCNVEFTDINPLQVDYLKKKLYPSRYKKWDDKVQYVSYKKIFSLKKKFDLIVLGVPPEHHIKLLINCIDNLRFKKILIEKPLCVFNQNFINLKKIKNKNKIYCGFNHSISKSFFKLSEIIKSKKIGKITKIEINWKEDFNYVLKAHPWINSLKESYLSNINLGGGGCHEYSHAIHLGIILKKIIFNNLKFRLSKKIKFKKIKNNFYDFKSDIILKNKNNMIKINIDTISKKIDKSITIFGNQGKLFWLRDMTNNQEKITLHDKNGKIKKSIKFKVYRKDDFINEHKNFYIKKNSRLIKNLNLDNSIETMVLISKLFKNVQKI